MQQDPTQVHIHKEQIRRESDPSTDIAKERMAFTFTSRRNDIIKGEKFQDLMEQYPLLRQGFWVSILRTVSSSIVVDDIELTNKCFIYFG